MDHTIVHFEIPADNPERTIPSGQSRADNPERATKFYCELFGWEIQKWASSGAKSPSDTGRPE